MVSMSFDISDASDAGADDTLEWDEIIEWVRKDTKMEIWLKGGEIKAARLQKGAG